MTKKKSKQLKLKDTKKRERENYISFVKLKIQKKILFLLSFSLNRKILNTRFYFFSFFLQQKPEKQLYFISFLTIKIQVFILFYFIFSFPF